MLSGPGFSERYPTPNDHEYLRAAQEQTPVDLVRADAVHLRRAREALIGRGATLRGFQSESFLETVVLDTLGIDRTVMRERIRTKSTEEQDARVLLLAQNRDGRFYRTIGDIVGAAGYSVTVASPDELGRQDQSSANRNITYLRKSMGAFDDSDADPGFDFALMVGDHDELANGDEGANTQNQWAHYTPTERVRGILRVMRPAGRIIVTDVMDVMTINDLLTDDNTLKEKMTQNYETSYLRAYHDDGHQIHPISPYLILERRADQPESSGT